MIKTVNNSLIVVLRLKIGESWRNVLTHFLAKFSAKYLKNAFDKNLLLKTITFLNSRAAVARQVLVSSSNFEKRNLIVFWLCLF